MWKPSKLLIYKKRRTAFASLTLLPLTACGGGSGVKNEENQLGSSDSTDVQPITSTKTFSNGDVYSGEFLNGSRTGEGTYTWASGNVYSGDFVDGSLTGEGTITWVDGETYSGDFVDGSRTGEGTYTWASGNVYSGDFVDGSRTGEGTYTWVDGMSYTGGWVDGTPTGTPPYREGNAVMDVEPDVDTNVNAVLYVDSKRWVSNTDYESGDKIVITYSFVTSNSGLFDDGYSVPDPLTDSVLGFAAVHKAAVISALATYESFLNVEFQQITETDHAVGTLRFGFTDHERLQPDGDLSWGWAVSPGTSPMSGDIWVRQNHIDGEWGSAAESGSYNYGALMHEIGHALGLEHPHEGNILSEQYDYVNYTLMSYNRPDEAYYTGSDGVRQFLISSTPMVLDVAALQYLYGASNQNPNDDIYTFDETKPFVETIWDSGGVDTLDFSNFSSDLKVNLTPGVESYSTIAFADWTMEDNLGLAYGTMIENANGGSGADVIIGNETNNILNGYDGDDIIYGLDGDDVFDATGRWGADTFYGGLGDDNYYVYSSIASDIIVEYANEGIDTVRINSTSQYTLPENVERLVVFNNDENKVLTGNNLDNTIAAKGGDDIIYGLGGDDIIYCGAGNDIISGGTGSDKFIFYLGDGQNVITDFEMSADSCYVADDTGNVVNIIEYENVNESENIAGNAVLTLFDGTSVTLEGISSYLPNSSNIDSGLVA